jgi:hypothetical protein
MGIERDLHELLYCHDCVIVPEWGGFLAHYRSARIDEARRMVHPPGRELSFNRHLVRSDGLLADHFARRTGVDFSAATERINDAVNGWRNALDRDGRLELPHIGVFYRDAEHNLQFDPDKRANYLRDAYGLRPVAAVPVERTRPAPVVRELPVEMPGKAEVVGQRGQRVLWAAAAVAAVVFGAAALYTYRLAGTGAVQWSDLDPFTKHTERSYVPPQASGSQPVSTASVFSLPDGPLGVQRLPLTEGDSVQLTVDLGRPAAIEAAVDSTAVAAPKQVTNMPRARFHVIGGCFAQPENAERFHAELVSKGFPAVKLAQHGDLHPVAFGSYPSRAEALDALARVRSSGAGAAWLLVR